MNRRPPPPSPRFHPPAYRRAFARLDAALAANTETNHSERLKLLGQFMFGDDWMANESRAATETPNPTHGS
jgi:hypothetical protein